MDKQFRTPDLNLASFLYASGVPLITLNFDDPYNIFFVFNDPPPDLLIKFRMGTAEGNILAYSNARRDLQHMLKRGNGG